MKHYLIPILSALMWLGTTAPGRAEAPRMCPNPAAVPIEKERTMLSDAPQIDTEAIPAIDRTAPAAFKTAAFGLG